MWSPSADPAALLEAAEGIGIYGLGPREANEVLPVTESAFADERGPDARALLFRGLIRYLADDVDDALARADFLEVLARADAAADDTLAVRALARLAQLDVWAAKQAAELAEADAAERLAQARAWLDTAEARLTNVRTDHVRADVAYRRAEWAGASKRPDTEMLALRAARQFAAAGVLERWWAAMCLRPSLDDPAAADLSALETQARALGCLRAVCVRQMAGLLARRPMAAPVEAFADWLAALSEEDLQHVLPFRRPLVADALARVGRPALAQRLYELDAAEAGDAEERFVARLGARALAAQQDPGAVVALVELVEAGLSEGVPALRVVQATAQLLRVSAHASAERALRAVLAEPSLAPDVGAAALLNLVGTLVETGRHAEAATHFAAIDPSLLDDEAHAIWHINGGVLYGVAGRTEEAAERTERALATLRTAATSAEVAIALCNALTFNGGAAAAPRWAAELAALLPPLPPAAAVRARLVLAERSKGRAARDHFEAAYASAEAYGDRGLLATVCLYYAHAVADVQTCWRLLLMAEEALGADYPGAKAVIVWNKALLCRDPTRRRRALARAGRLLEAAGRIDLAADAYADVALLTASHARAVHHGRSALRLALRLASSCADPVLRARALERMRPVGSTLLRRHLDAAQPGAALEVAYRVKGAAALRPLDTTALDPALAGALQQAMRPVQNPRVALGTALRHATLPDAAGALLRAETTARRDPRLRDAYVRAAAVQRALAPDEVAVEYALLREDHALLLFVIHRDRIDVVRRRWTRTHDDAARNVADVLSGRLHGGVRRVWHALLRTLHDTLIAPLGVLQRHAARIYAAPGGLLSEIPFQALVDRDGVAVIDRMDLRLLVSTAQLALLPRTRRRLARACVLRGSDDGLGALTGADRERDAVLRALGASGVTVAGEPSAIADADVIHYVGHARFDRVSGRGELFLPGYRLTDDGLAAMRLHRRPTIVLSACESGRASSGVDSMTGFLRGAFAAGARDVVVSGWPADDAATAALMEGFHSHLCRGLGPARALRTATLEVRARCAAHPFQWANFRCYGRG